VSYSNHLDLRHSSELCTTCHLQLKLHLTKVLLVFRHDFTNRLTRKLEGLDRPTFYRPTYRCRSQ